VSPVVPGLPFRIVESGGCIPGFVPVLSEN
jgi:hypothetical protein